MARVDINQMRQWQNGDIINAGEYNDERNLLALANNDTNDKANRSILDSQNALEIATTIQRTGLPAAEGSVIKQEKFTAVGGQTSFTPATPFIANTNRVQVFKNGVLTAHTEPSNTRIEFPALSTGDQMIVRYFTDVPDIFEVDRLQVTLDSAEATWAQAQTATTSANNAATSANTAKTQANTARDAANAAATSANNAAASATNQANYAKAEGDKIAPKITEANTAITNANAATSSANTAASAANTAKTAADTAASSANAAATSANTAASNANTKATLANDKATLANNAATAANSAATAATTAKDAANAATTAANTATSNANTAASNANTKATIAQTAADNADLKAQAAVQATTDARTAITDMQTATGTAITQTNTARDAANTAAGNATTQATYAKNQGDYAKAQGDLAAEIVNGNMPDATPSSSGLMSGPDKAKLDGVAPSANNYVHPTTDGNRHVPATGTTNNGRFLKAGATAGLFSWGTISWSEVLSKPTTVATSGLTDAETTSGAQAKANAAEANAKAASLASVAGRASNVDLNTYVTSGEFALGSGLTNAPSGVSFCTILVSNSSSDRITQIVMAPGQSKAFIRYGTGTTTVWSAWIELETTSGAQAKVDAHAALAAPHVSSADRTNWDAKETPAGAQGKVDSHANNTAVHVTSTEKTTWNNKANNVLVTTTVDGLMAATDKVKLNGIATGANNYTHPAAHPPSIITQDASNRFVTDNEKSAWNAKASTAVATTGANGLMSSTDKVKLNGIAPMANEVRGNTTNGYIEVNGVLEPVYTHPATHPASVIAQDSINQFVTADQKNAWTNARTDLYAAPVWLTLTLQNSWIRYATYSTPEVTKDTHGIVQIRGWVKDGADGTVCATLPSDYRPLRTQIFITAGTPGTKAIYRVSIDSAGAMTINQMAGTSTTGLISLDGITFSSES